MKFIFYFLLLLIGIALANKNNDRQKFAGVQFRLKQDFFDVTVIPIMKLFQGTLNRYKDRLIPTDLIVSNVINITNFRMDDLVLED